MIHLAITFAIAVSVGGSAHVPSLHGPSSAQHLMLFRSAESSALPSPDTTHIRVRLRTTPDSAYQAVSKLLTDRGYTVNDGAAHSLTTSDRNVAGAGMVRIRASVSVDSLGSVVHLTGEWRRLRRFLMLSAVTLDSTVIAQGAGGSRGTRAWEELHAIGESLGGVMTYGTAKQP